MVKTINETFSEEEYDELKSRKGKMSWREYILNKEVDKHDNSPK